MTAAATLPGDLRVKEHCLKVPLDHNKPDGTELSLFVRELMTASKANEDLPWLLYLQGGPGFPSGRPTCPPSGWIKPALAKYRVLLLDQRGTGRSSPVTTKLLQALPGGPEAQAELLSHFRADSIVRDAEIVRHQLAGGQKITLLGQSFGGFCILTYLSLFPEAISRSLCTFGLAPIGRTAEEVYAATFRRMEERNRRFYRRYPQDVEVVRSIVAALHSAPVALPRGGTLTARRFLQLGLLLGSASGFETLHGLLELACAPNGDVLASSLPDIFLLEVENAQQQFETNPIYWLLHEAIYVDGATSAAGDTLKDSRLGAPSCWAAERMQALLGATWDYTTRLAVSSPPVQLTGEMVFSWMGDDYAWLRPLKPVANLLASKADWGPLYNVAALGRGQSPVAALVSYEDVYVERSFSEETASLLGERAQLWITNEFQHSGLRDEPAVVFERLLAMSKGELAIPS
eukprot:CAMPEP_0119301888 /NCGR_PEP_ID=MMETSP1333-20130426/3591_1 /TAXON_ID=418940 /ORGANISM="Scyphosphaera apsteinii, Strain RCC1455" /LENGTH=460 /DNA_ID=CAMNT_0007304095 /DNA_START=88 /DNA_END=1470 /DNA_ORIENTATION=-